ncbi:endonuclease III [Anopheles sinensis]|uniref:Endonuclease III n=1 Tax=Anopheles sinensis TaxID=74873 RepID=A0A084VHZ4_ANOSI|nr:endonuclease III [Anopheles sinensis]
MPNVIIAMPLAYGPKCWLDATGFWRRQPASCTTVTAFRGRPVRRQKPGNLTNHSCDHVPSRPSERQNAVRVYNTDMFVFVHQRRSSRSTPRHRRRCTL